MKRDLVLSAVNFLFAFMDGKLGQKAPIRSIILVT